MFDHIFEVVFLIGYGIYFFGEEYGAYMKRTVKVLPRLRAARVR